MLKLRYHIFFLLLSKITDSNRMIIRDSLFLDTLYVTLRMKLQIVSSMNRASGCDVLSLLLIYDHKFPPRDSIISHSWNSTFQPRETLFISKMRLQYPLATVCVPQECKVTRLSRDDCRSNPPLKRKPAGLRVN